jgi:hypothetical protein
MSVLLDPFTNADAGVEATGDDIAQRIVDHDVQHYIGMRVMKGAGLKRSSYTR